jgi:hypothetical protein
MSLSTVEGAMTRIELAAKDSPLAVFKAAAVGMVEVFPANTVLTQAMIKQGGPDFVGLFHKDKCMAAVRRRLVGAVAV